MYIAMKSLCKTFAIPETGKEAATEFFLGPLADISSLFDAEREFGIRKKGRFACQ